MRRAPSILMSITVALFLGLLVISKPAALEVQIHGESSLEIYAEPAGTVFRLAGILRDDVGAGLPVQDISVEVRRAGRIVVEETVLTDYGGNFAFVAELEPGSYHVQAAYGGSSHISASRESLAFTLEVEPVELIVEAPNWVYGEDPSAEIMIRATVEDRGLPTFVVISLQGEPLDTVDLDFDGTARFDIGRHLAVGHNAVDVRIEESSHRQAAARQVVIRYVASIDLTGQAEEVFRRLRRGIEVSVVVRDEIGGIEGVNVEFRLDPVDEGISHDSNGETPAARLPLLREVKTDHRGDGAAFFSFDEMGAQPWEVSARVFPPHSEPLVWSGGELSHTPSSWAALVQMLALIALLVGGLWLSRGSLHSLWSALRASLGRRGGGEKEVHEAEEAVFAPVESLELMTVADLAGDDDEGTSTIMIQVWDEWKSRPLAGARLILSGPGQDGERLELISTENGVVAVPQLSDGQWTIEVEASGFVPGRTQVEMPTLRDRFRLVLTPVPLKIRRMYRWMVKQADGEDPWGRLTPREIEEALLTSQAGVESDSSEARVKSSDWREFLKGWEELDDQGRIDQLLRAITEVVEETNFSGRNFEKSVWEISRALMKELATKFDDPRPRL